jgi:hypothetical protein
MGLKSSRTRPGRGLIRVKFEPDETLLGLKSSQTRNGVKIKPDKALLGLKSAKPDKALLGSNRAGQSPDEPRMRSGRGALIGVKILSGNAGFERAVLPGASSDSCRGTFIIMVWQNSHSPHSQYIGLLNQYFILFETTV